MGLKIAYVTAGDSEDVTSWSGTPFHMARALHDDGTEVERIGPLPAPYRTREGLKRRAYRAFGKTYHPYRNSRVARRYAREVARRLTASSASVVLSPGAVPIAYLDTNLPAVVWSDATFAGLVGYYPGYGRLARETLEDGYAMEAALFERAAAAIFASEWAAGSALQTYDLDPSLVHVIPYGSNLDGPTGLDAARAIIRARPQGECRLLFVGVDWRRKGGEEALKIAQRLNDRGLTTTLTIVGCSPDPPRPLPRFVRVEGFVSKASGAGSARLRALFVRSHLLLLPTVADAFAIVLAEASSHAVPSLATDTGGIPTVVRSGRNGELFPLGDVEGYCTCVERLFNRYEDEYVAYAEASFDEARTRLNWAVSGAAARSVLESLAS